MAPLRKSVNQTIVDAPALKGKGKIIEAVEPADCRPNLSYVHISDAEDSHPNIALPLEMQTIEPEPSLNSDQSTRCFPHAEADGESTNRDDLAL